MRKLRMITVKVNEDNILIECKEYTYTQKLNIEVPKGFVQSNERVLKIVADQIGDFCKKYEIPEHEIYLVQYFFMCKNYIHEALRKNYPEYFI